MTDQASNPLREEIQKAISENPVLLFMKGTPEQPACGFSARTVAILQSLGQPFAAVDVLPDPRIRQELSALSNWPTIPQLFVDGELRRRLRHRDRDVPVRRAPGGARARRRRSRGARARGAAGAGAAALDREPAVARPLSQVLELPAGTPGTARSAASRRSPRRRSRAPGRAAGRSAPRPRAAALGAAGRGPPRTRPPPGPARAPPCRTGTASSSGSCSGTASPRLRRYAAPRPRPAGSRRAGGRRRGARLEPSRSRYQAIVSSRQSSCGEVFQRSSRLALALENAQFSDEARTSTGEGILGPRHALGARRERQREAKRQLQRRRLDPGQSPEVGEQAVEA